MKLFLAFVVLARVALPDVVTEWNAILRTTISTETPQSQSRLSAITHLAMFEAVNAITGDYEPYLRTVRAGAGASPEAAAVVAAHQVLSHFFPGRVSILDADRARSLS